jgi:hypothetical protein
VAPSRWVRSRGGAVETERRDGAPWAQLDRRRECRRHRNTSPSLGSERGSCRDGGADTAASHPDTATDPSVLRGP